MERNTDLVANGETQNLKNAVRQYYFLDAACDAANAHFVRTHGQAHAHSSADIRASAEQGITMLFRALTIPGDPMQLRPKTEKKANEYIGQLVQRVAKLRKASEAKTAKRKKEAEEERLAVEAEAAERARKARRNNLSGTMLLLFVLLLASVVAVSR